MRRLLLALALCAGGCNEDLQGACDPFAGTACISLEVRPPAGGLSVDQIQIVATSGFHVPEANQRMPAMAGSPFALPVLVPVLPGNSFAGGAFELDVNGLVKG